MALCSVHQVVLVDYTRVDRVLQTKQSLRVHRNRRRSRETVSWSQYTPKNTEKTDKWAIDNYTKWRKWRNENCPQDPAPSCIEPLSSWPQQVAFAICCWHSRCKETRLSTSYNTQFVGWFVAPYAVTQPSCSCCQVSWQEESVVQRTAQNFGQSFPSLTRGRGWTASEACRGHHKARGGSVVGEWGTWNEGSQNAVFYYNGKNFCLRGGVEHRELKVTHCQPVFFFRAFRGGSFHPEMLNFPPKQ